MPYIRSAFTPLRSLFTVHLVFSIIFAFANLFMNIYLWDTGKSFWNIGVFNLFSVVSIFLASLLGAYFLQWMGTRSTFIGSSILALFLFSYLFLSGPNKASVLPLLGMLYGGYVGLFYIGFNLHILWLSKNSNRSLLIGLESTITTLAQLLTPLCAGLFITRQGYPHTFLLITCLLLFQFVLSFRIPSMRMKERYRKRYFFLAENERMAQIGFASASYGFYFAFVQMSYGLFFYFLIQDELQLGLWNFIFGGVSAFMYWFVGRTLNQTNRDIFLSMGMIASMVITLTLLLSAPFWFVLFNLTVSVSLPMLWIPTKATHYTQMIDIAEQYEKESGSRLGRMMQLLVFREFSISLGRICFFLLMVMGFDFGWGASYYIMLMLACFMPLGIWVLGKPK